MVFAIGPVLRSRLLLSPARPQPIFDTIRPHQSSWTCLLNGEQAPPTGVRRHRTNKLRSDPPCLSWIPMTPTTGNLLLHRNDLRSGQGRPSRHRRGKNLTIARVVMTTMMQGILFHKLRLRTSIGLFSSPQTVVLVNENHKLLAPITVTRHGEDGNWLTISYPAQQKEQTSPRATGDRRRVLDGAESAGQGVLEGLQGEAVGESRKGRGELGAV